MNIGRYDIFLFVFFFQKPVGCLEKFFLVALKVFGQSYDPRTYNIDIFAFKDFDLLQTIFQNLILIAFGVRGKIVIQAGACRVYFIIVVVFFVFCHSGQKCLALRCVSIWHN